MLSKAKIQFFSITLQIAKNRSKQATTLIFFPEKAESPIFTNLEKGGQKGGQEKVNFSLKLLNCSAKGRECCAKKLKWHFGGWTLVLIQFARFPCVVVVFVEWQKNLQCLCTSQKNFLSLSSWGKYTFLLFASFIFHNVYVFSTNFENTKNVFSSTLENHKTLLRCTKAM